MSRFRNWSAPTVTANDYGYITDQDIKSQKSSLLQRLPGDNPSTSDDDEVLLKFGDKTARTCLPPYSINEGKVFVRDIRFRAGLLFGINDDALKRARLIYKSTILDDENRPVQYYAIKNRSVIAVELDDADAALLKKSKSKKTKKRSAGAGTAAADDAEKTKAAQKPATPIDRINELEKYFNDNLESLCRKFIKAPPADVKLRQKEGMRLAEVTMQHVTLKLDAVETNGDQEVRARRKKVMQRIEGIIKEVEEVQKR